MKRNACHNVGPQHAAHAASLVEDWDAPVTPREFVGEFLSGAVLIGGLVVVVWMLFA